MRMFPTDAGMTAGTRPLQCRGVAPGHRTAKAPARGLSALHSMASGLAVYASPDGLPRLGAKLASSRWSDATGRAFHPQGPNRRFQSVFVISSSFSKLAWRNRCGRSAQHASQIAFGGRTAARYRSGVRSRVLRRAGLEGQGLDGGSGVSDTAGERITDTGRWRLISLAAGRPSSTGLEGGKPARRRRDRITNLAITTALRGLTHGRSAETRLTPLRRFTSIC